MVEFKSELKKAIDKYGKESVEIVLNENTGYMYGGYHSLKDSFPVTNNYQLIRYSAIELSNKLNIGWFEIEGEG